MIKDTAETIEFFNPALGLDLKPYIANGDISGAHHLARYHWACGALAPLAPSRVLDIACGAGYGSAMLANALQSSRIIGADYDERAVSFATRQERASNLEFTVGDIVTWKKGGQPLGIFDAIVSFDTIEHLLHRDIALMRMSDNLSDDGVLLLSTPCGHDQTLLNPAWEHHKIEYSHHDLVPLMKRFFEVVMEPQHPDFPNAAFWRDLNHETTIYLNLGNPLVCRNPIRVR